MLWYYVFIFKEGISSVALLMVVLSGCFRMVLEFDFVWGVWKNSWFSWFHAFFREGVFPRIVERPLNKSKKWTRPADVVEAGLVHFLLLFSGLSVVFCCTSKNFSPAAGWKKGGWPAARTGSTASLSICSFFTYHCFQNSFFIDHSKVLEMKST